MEVNGFHWEQDHKVLQDFKAQLDFKGHKVFKVNTGLDLQSLVLFQM
jgi:hypothetical protein